MSQLERHRVTEATTIVGPDTHFKGEISGPGHVAILGVFEGSIVGASQLTIGPAARVQANVEADVIRVDGSVTGNIAARERLTLGPRAIVHGDIRAAALGVEEGAAMTGRMTIGSAVATDTPMDANVGVKTAAAGRAKLPGAWAGTGLVETGEDWLSQAGVTVAKPDWLAGTGGMAN